MDMWCVRKVPGLELQIICNKKLYRLQLSPFTVVPLMSNTLPYSAPPCFHPLLEWFFWNTPQLCCHGPHDGFHVWSFQMLEDIFMIPLNLGKRNKITLDQVVWVGRLPQHSTVFLGQELLADQWVVSQRIVIVDQSWIVSPQFPPLLTYWMKRTLQDLFVDMVVNRLALWQELSVDSAPYIDECVQQDWLWTSIVLLSSASATPESSTECSGAWSVGCTQRSMNDYPASLAHSRHSRMFCHTCMHLSFWSLLAASEPYPHRSAWPDLIWLSSRLLWLIPSLLVIIWTVSWWLPWTNFITCSVLVSILLIVVLPLLESSSTSSHHILNLLCHLKAWVWQCLSVYICCSVPSASGKIFVSQTRNFRLVCCFVLITWWAIIDDILPRYEKITMTAEIWDCSHNNILPRYCVTLCHSLVIIPTLTAHTAHSILELFNTPCICI